MLITDSGGLQKEAFFAKKPCVTLRFTSEWKETFTGRWNRLAKISDKDDMFTKIQKAIKFNTFSKQQSFFGKGNSSSIILDYLIKIS